MPVDNQKGDQVTLRLFNMRKIGGFCICQAYIIMENGQCSKIFRIYRYTATTNPYKEFPCVCTFNLTYINSGERDETA
jgi:hypothetical protein